MKAALCLFEKARGRETVVGGKLQTPIRVANVRSSRSSAGGSACFPRPPPRRLEGRSLSRPRSLSRSWWFSLSRPSDRERERARVCRPSAPSTRASLPARTRGERERERFLSRVRSRSRSRAAPERRPAPVTGSPEDRATDVCGGRSRSCTDRRGFFCARGPVGGGFVVGSGETCTPLPTFRLGHCALDARFEMVGERLGPVGGGADERTVVYDFSNSVLSC